MQDDWAYNEWCRTPLWDQRCRTTLVLSCQQLAQQAQVSFSRALGSRRKAVSRILHHKETTPDTLLSGHVRATALRCQAEELVLIASDTTSGYSWFFMGSKTCLSKIVLSCLSTYVQFFRWDERLVYTCLPEIRLKFR